MRIAAVSRALPDFCYPQDEIRQQLERIWADKPAVTRRLESIFANTRVEQRHLALPLEEYGRKRTFGESNDEWIRVSQDLGEKALRAALDDAGLAPEDVDAIYAVSITGVASPSLDARLANRMRLRTDVKRNPIFGLGCVAGAAGIARAADYVKAFPDQVAVLVSVELCSLTFQPEDLSAANVISCGLFGDGAAAVVIVGEERARRMGIGGLRIVDTRSVFYHDTEDVMGWTISERGFDIVLSPEVPAIAKERLAPAVDGFLGKHGLVRSDIASWVCHPGGPKVLEAMRDGLGLTDDDVQFAWNALREQGNLSSSSVLMVLHETLEKRRIAADAVTRGGGGTTLAEGPGTSQWGLILAMGPAFCSEAVLFEWR